VLAVLPTGTQLLAQQADSAAAPACELRSAGESAVAAVTGPQTLRLVDGRSIHLAEIIAVAPPPRADLDPDLDPVSYLKAAIGKKVEVKVGGTERDRYGVVTAHLFVASEPSLWLEDGLVAAGLALAAPQADNKACFQRLRATESAARSQGRGNWGTSVFKILPASDPRVIANLVQTYQIVEGEVKSVARSGSRVTLNFGDEKKFAFKAFAEGPAAKRIGGANGESLVGKTVRIRGWVERKQGPSITEVLPEQIEIVGVDVAQPR